MFGAVNGSLFESQQPCLFRLDVRRKMPDGGRRRAQRIANLTAIATPACNLRPERVGGNRRPDCD